MGAVICVRQLGCARRKRVVKEGNEYKEVEERTYRITIPPAIIEELGWQESDYIKMQVKDGKLILELHARGV